MSADSYLVYGINETSIFCNVSLHEVTNFNYSNVKRIGLNGGKRIDVTIAIDFAQRHAVEELLLSRISNRGGIMVGRKNKTEKGTLKYLAIIKSEEPEYYDFESLQKDSLETIRIDECKIGKHLKLLMQKIAHDNLMTLSITSSAIFDLEYSVFPMKYLRSLSLAGNNLTAFPRNVFHYKMLDLWNLDLSENRLELIWPDLFDMIPNLMSLNLQGNNFRSLKPFQAVFPKLREFLLGDTCCMDCQDLCWTFTMDDQPNLFDMTSCKINRFGLPVRENVTLYDPELVSICKEINLRGG